MWSSPKGVMQSPVTPMNDDFSLDPDTFEKLIDWHIRQDATGIVWPYHKGESLDLSLDERRSFAEIAVKTAAGRVPVVIHVSALAVDDTLALARHAQEIGASAVVSITPYFWNPTPDQIVDHFVRLGQSLDIAFLGYNSPGYLSGIGFDADIVARLIERLPNFVGIKEASFNGERFAELCRGALALRPSFALMTGTEYLLPSVPLGGSGSYSAGGAIAPKLVNSLYAACAAKDWDKARELQNRVSRLWLLFKDQYPSSLKGGMALMGRPVGPTRAPLPTAGDARQAEIKKELQALGVFDDEAMGW